MRAKLSRIGLRDLALFVAVAGIVAVAAVFAAREAGLDGGRAGATDGQLSLSLSVSQQICETERAWEFSLGESRRDEDGNWVQSKTVLGWWRIPSLPVVWQVSGGQEPYTLVIDHESADQHGDYEGATGTAQVGCADASVGTSFWPLPEIGRLYDVDPEVDSGWKTVRAVVTDANGDTAEATARFYVILNLGGGTTGEILKRGETYRIYDRLLTAPSSYDIEVGGVVEQGCEGLPAGRRCESASGFSLVGGNAWILLYESDLAEDSRGYSGVAGADSSQRANADAALDAFAESVDAVPRPREESTP